MRRSRLMLSAGLAAVAFASNAQAATVIIQISGTYTAGSDASLPATGIVSGEIFVDTMVNTKGSNSIFYIQSGSYIRFGTDSNSYEFLPAGSDRSYLVQGPGYNHLGLYYYSAALDFNFGVLSPDPTIPYTFSDTPVNTDFSAIVYSPSLKGALGALDAPGEYWPTANLTFTTVSAASAVPEPATWALMIGGFGMAGAALRRRRTVTVAA